jgi:regulator of protease activity HflC (stomatin/prohibitin superfamily)
MNYTGWIFGGAVLVIVLAFAGCWGVPQYGVYSQRLEGEAELAKANYSKQVAVQEANAKKDSATLLAEAEVMRARGVAQANKIIGDSLKDNESYLRYLWISEMKETKDQIIYVPTEANLPILEAGRLSRVAPTPASK